MKNERKLIQKWNHLKREIRLHPLLAYRLGIHINDLQKYFETTPPDAEILRIEKVIFEDRAYKTLRIRDELKKLIGYREVPNFASRIGISDTKLRAIMEGKDMSPSYEIINKIEIYLHAITGFTISIENNNSETYIDQELDRLSNQTVDIGLALISYKRDIKELRKPRELFYADNKIMTTAGLLIEKLENLKETFIDNPDLK